MFCQELTYNKLFCLAAADELLQQYRIENKRLVAENEDLRSELALTRQESPEKHLIFREI